MKVKIYVGMPMEEKFLMDLFIGNGEYRNCRIPRKGDILILDDKSYRVKLVMNDYDDDEYVIFVKDYVWGEKDGKRKD